MNCCIGGNPGLLVKRMILLIAVFADMVKFIFNLYYANLCSWALLHWLLVFCFVDLSSQAYCNGNIISVDCWNRYIVNSCNRISYYQEKFQVKIWATIIERVVHSEIYWLVNMFLIWNWFHPMLFLRLVYAEQIS